MALWRRPMNRTTAVSERREAGEEQDSSTKSARLDQPARVEAQSRPTLPSIIGQSFTAVPVLRPQAQTPGSESRAASARPERSSSDATCRLQAR